MNLQLNSIDPGFRTPQHICSRVVLVSVPAGWGCSTVLDRVEAEITSQDAAPVASTIRINSEVLPDLASLQAQMLRSLLAAVTGRHRTAALLGLDRPAPLNSRSALAACFSLAWPLA
jgi:hypothetical protein